MLCNCMQELSVLGLPKPTTRASCHTYPTKHMVHSHLCVHFHHIDWPFEIDDIAANGQHLSQSKGEWLVCCVHKSICQKLRNLYAYDSVSERLRRWTRNPLGSARRGSNPLGVVLLPPLLPVNAVAQAIARPSSSTIAATPHHTNQRKKSQRQSALLEHPC